MSQLQRPGGLVALVADRDIEEALAKLFARPKSLGVKPFPFQIARHPNRDSGCRVDATNYLRQFLRTHDRALVVFDRHGSGSSFSRDEIERILQEDLERNGWGTRGRAIVIDPELEAWVWSGSDAVAEALGWRTGYRDLRSWLCEEGMWDRLQTKPRDPKAAMRSVLANTQIRRSARIFGRIASSVPVERCRDAAFAKLKSTLREWYSA